MKGFSLHFSFTPALKSCNNYQNRRIVGAFLQTSDKTVISQGDEWLIHRATERRQSLR
jgi:hypothetical protein